MYRETFTHSVTIPRSSCTDGNDMLIANIPGYGILKSRMLYPNSLQNAIQYHIIVLIHSQTPKMKTLKIEGERGTVINPEKYD